MMSAALRCRDSALSLLPAALVLSLLPLCPALPPSRVHAFYYAWYGTPAEDGKWQHWDHEVLPHWTPDVNEQHPTIGQRFSPPSDLHSPFFPARGPYSSRSRDTILQHFQEMASAGIGVAVVSWWGQQNRSGTADTQGVQTDAVLPHIFAAAEQQGAVQLAFHLEPYPGRTALSVRSDVEYLLRQFGDSPALFRWDGLKPLFYVYDSYHIEPKEWAQVLAPEGEHTLRHTPWDGVFIGLWLENGDFHTIQDAHFDGAYPYFASEASSYGATWARWPLMSTILHNHNMLFFPSVGPGYDDSLIRPWNAHALRERKGGDYYRRAWGHALGSRPDAVSITSFNEWGEGTQIEPAQHQVRAGGREYQDYGPGGPGLYLDITADLARDAEPLGGLESAPGPEAGGQGSSGSPQQRDEL